MIERITELLKHDTAGDPMGGLKWTRKTTRKIAQALRRGGIPISAGTVGRLLGKMEYSLRVNCKKIESGIKHPPPRKVRNRQFHYIGERREDFAGNRLPIISVDTKKKEMIGNFRNTGTTWEREPVAVYDHDFRSDAKGMAAPYGIYDTQENRGYVFVGMSHDTPAFAVDCIEKWWTLYGRRNYPQAGEMLILADSGGSNGSRSRVWKWRLKTLLCERHHLKITVCHYPPGSSKWNPIEHRLFSAITENWQATPLDSLETALNYIRTTQTRTGLKVNARLMKGKYETGEKVPDRQMRMLRLTRHEICPDWNYTIRA